MTETIPPPPEGFIESQNRGAFSTLNGPYFHRAVTPDLTEQAFFALPRHANGIGLVHGGMLSAFMDGLLAGAVGRGSGLVAVTIHLSIDFLHMARVGATLALVSHADFFPGILPPFQGLHHPTRSGPW